MYKNKCYTYQVKNVIILTSGECQEAWGSLSEICRVHSWPYHSLKFKKYPFEFRGVTINRVRFRFENKNL